MFEFNLTYPEFKAIAAKKKSFWQHIERTKHYDVFIVDGPLRYFTVVWKTTEGVGGIDVAVEEANLTDYQANYLPDSNRPLDITPTAAQSQFYGGTIEMSAEDTEGYCEWSFEQDVFVNKALPMPVDALKGDYLSFEVWTKGEAPQKVGQYAFNVPIRGSYPLPWVYGSGGGVIPSTCTVRCYYHKAAGAARDFNIITEFLI